MEIALKLCHYQTGIGSHIATILHLDESLQHPDNKCLQMDQKIALS